MPSRALHFCMHPGCDELTDKSYCPTHMAEYEQRQKERKAQFDKKRESASKRGYGTRWQKYSAGFLRKPENQICKLHLPGCTLIAQCVDHIDPPDSPSDPRFWDKANHQAACIHCNSVKGHRKLKGTYDMMDEIKDKEK